MLSRMLLAGLQLAFLTSCVGHREKLPSGRTARILRVYRDEAVSDRIAGAYGSALVVSYCSSNSPNEQADVVVFAEQRAGVTGETTVVIDRHENPLVLVLGCGRAKRSAYVYDGGGEWHDVIVR
jgi:hypothetical protein